MPPEWSWKPEWEAIPGVYLPTLLVYKIYIYKVNFEKAFSNIGKKFLLEMLKQHGFGPKRISLMAAILNNPCLALVIIGKWSSYLRGIKPGNLISPLLFILVANVPDRILKRAAL